MEKLIVAKFGGSAIGVDGEGLPVILDRIRSLKSDSTVVAVCSAPLTMVEGEKISLTDVMLNLGNNAANGNEVNMEIIEKSYSKILEMVSEKYKLKCKEIIDEMLGLAAKSLA